MTRLHIYLLVTLTLWSSAFVVIRELVSNHDPLLIAALRLALAGVFAFFYLAIEHQRFKIAAIDIAVIGLLGILGLSIYNIALMIGETFLDAGTTSFIIAQTPIFSLIVAVILLKESIFIRAYIGMVVCFAGVVIIYLSTNGLNTQINQGMLWIFMATLSQSIYFVLQKVYIKKYSSLHVTLYSMIGAAIPAIVYLPFNLEAMLEINTGDAILIGYLALMPSLLAYYLWAKALQYLPTILVTNTLYFLPVLTIMQSWLFLNEYPLIGQVIGGLVALVGIFIVQQGDILNRTLFKKHHIS